MLSKSPTTTAAMTFAFSGDARVRLAAGLPCPHCGHGLHASDVDANLAKMSSISEGNCEDVNVSLSTGIICSNCHKDVLVVEVAS